MIPARLLEDCARNLRIAYQLPVPVSVAVLEAAGANNTTVTQFSRVSPGAADHVKAVFPLSPPIRAEGVIGSTELIVTYGSLSGPANQDSIATLEAQLQAATCDLSIPASHH